ncbi:MAG: hypothetical protein GY847_02150 [Proteobacteria bacterium]|nr:hypothetical protein [Pseudomonadota bacterium]
MLTSYRGTIKKGQIQLEEPVNLPEGAQILIVVDLSLAEVETRQRRLASLSESEWQAPFAVFEQSAQQLAQDTPLEIAIESVSDQELVDLVHQVRADQESKA